MGLIFRRGFAENPKRNQGLKNMENFYEINSKTFCRKENTKKL